MAHNESCSDERLAEIILKLGDLRLFNDEYWHPELKKYEGRHEAVLESLRRGTRHHMEGNFTDTEFSDDVNGWVNKRDEVVDNMWYNSYDCTHHKKSEEFYNMFNDEVCTHVKDNIQPKLESVEQVNLLGPLASNWELYKSTIAVFKELFQHLTLWIEDVPEDETPMDGIQNIGLKAFKNEVVLEEGIREKMRAVLSNLTDEHQNRTNVNNNAIRTVRDLLKEIDNLEQEEENQEINQSVKTFEIVPNSQIEAAIVRVMESSEVLEHDDLVDEVMKEINGKLQSQVEQCIGKLIEKDNLERDQADNKKYRYKS